MPLVSLLIIPSWNEQTIFSPPGAIPVHGAHYGQGVGLVYLDKLQCTGSEANLLECPGLPVGTSQCFHNRDASVICRNSGQSKYFLY